LLDLAIGLASPALGFIASGAGLSSVFLVGALVTLSASGVAIRLLLSEHATTRCADTRQAKRAC
jgi:hypothetical protein